MRACADAHAIRAWCVRSCAEGYEVGAQQGGSDEEDEEEAEQAKVLNALEVVRQVRAVCLCVRLHLRVWIGVCVCWRWCGRCGLCVYWRVCVCWRWHGRCGLCAWVRVCWVRVRVHMLDVVRQMRIVCVGQRMPTSVPRFYVCECECVCVHALCGSPCLNAGNHG